jgi:hypothetical protein
VVTLAWTRQRAEQLIEQQLGPQWSFAFDRARTRVGCCHFQAHRITLSRHLLPQLSPLEAEQAILHELAHALSGPRAGHGPQWRQAAAGLGYRLVDKDVAHPADRRPRNLGVGIGHGSGELGHCLADDLEIPHNRVGGHLGDDLVTGLE